MPQTLPMRSENNDEEAEIARFTAQAIMVVRDKNVIIDSDLAKIYGVPTRRLNEQVKRHAEKFPLDFAFRLTKEEFHDLKSQFATSSSSWGGKRKLPLVFTDYGALMAANVLRSSRASEVSIYIIRAFMNMRTLIQQQLKVSRKEKSIEIVKSPKAGESMLQEKMESFFSGIGPKLEQALNSVLDSVVDAKRGTTIRQEAQDLISESIKHIKSRLAKSGLENEEIAARIAKILAEAEREKEETKKTMVEREQMELATLVKKLRLVLEARRALTFHSTEATDPLLARLDSFSKVLKELAGD